MVLTLEIKCYINSIRISVLGTFVLINIGNMCDLFETFRSKGALMVLIIQNFHVEDKLLWNTALPALPAKFKFELVTMSSKEESREPIILSQRSFLLVSDEMIIH